MAWWSSFRCRKCFFARSVTIVALSSLVGAPRPICAPCWNGAILTAVGSRAALILIAWIAYYSASRSLATGRTRHALFAAPLFVVAMSNPVLGEIVGPWRWLATLIGFGGVLIAADLSTAPDNMAGQCWLCWRRSAGRSPTILARSLSQAVSTAALDGRQQSRLCRRLRRSKRPSPRVARRVQLELDRSRLAWSAASANIYFSRGAPRAGLGHSALLNIPRSPGRSCGAGRYSATCQPVTC